MGQIDLTKKMDYDDFKDLILFITAIDNSGDLFFEWAYEMVIWELDIEMLPKIQWLEEQYHQMLDSDYAAGFMSWMTNEKYRQYDFIDMVKQGN